MTAVARAEGRQPTPIASSGPEAGRRRRIPISPSEIGGGAATAGAFDDVPREGPSSRRSGDDHGPLRGDAFGGQDRLHARHPESRTSSDRRVRRSTIILTLALSAIPTASISRAQDDDLVAYLRGHQMELRVSGERLDGPAAAWLRDEAAKAQFLFIGEEHDTREIPLIAGALWRDLAPLGYGHAAIEAGQWLGGQLDAYARSGDRGALARFKASALPRRPNISVPPSSDEDVAFYELLGRAARPGGAADAPLIWGLDHEFKVTPLLERLVELAPDPGRRRRVQALLSRVEPAERAGTYDLRPFGAEVDALAADFRPTPGSEPAQILDAMGRLAAPASDDQARGELMKRLFLRNYRFAQGKGEARPRVMLRFGSYHGKRGLMSDFGTSTLANFVAEFALSEGSRMLNVIFISCSDGRPGHPRPCSPREKAWLRPFKEAAGSAWTLYDVRGLRPRLSGGSLDAGWELAEIIFGYDAVVWLRETEPCHFSP